MTESAVPKHISAGMLIKYRTKMYTSLHRTIYEMLIHIISLPAFA